MISTNIPYHLNYQQDKFVIHIQNIYNIQIIQIIYNILYMIVTQTFGLFLLNISSSVMQASIGEEGRSGVLIPLMMSYMICRITCSDCFCWRSRCRTKKNLQIFKAISTKKRNIIQIKIIYLYFLIHPIPKYYKHIEYL